MENNDKYIGTLLDDRYEILQVIGEGGMAIVYKALDHRLNRNVAVKIMREDMPSRCCLIRISWRCTTSATATLWNT